ncbi:MAG: Mrp/NBP35 family ATP-binding protein [Gammaproteobacteria bacterium]|nr:Mrp/NBP35 family ATP-binding protein [Gammaproteobacteria bacterium]
MKFSNIFSSKSNTDDKQLLRDLLSDLQTPNFPNGITGQLSIEQSSNSFHVKVPFNPEFVEDEIKAALATRAFDQPVTLSHQPPQKHKQAIANIKLVVAIASGKGGVGKSTVTANLAAALAKTGHKVGVLDADIYGPSVPLMFGLQGQQVESKDGKRMEPFNQHGVFLNSIGFLVPDEQAVVWRGPMASKALMQVINETNWPELDVLLVDMPPGTGDIQLTMSDTVKCDGALIVTTPQTVALADADKGINMFNKVATPIVGLVENMSLFVCESCGTSHALFGDSGGVECAKRHNVPLLAQLPLKQTIREAGDSGQLYGLTENNEYQPLAFSLMMQLSKQTENIIALG